MENINYQLLEAYKLLDKICREMYRGEKGVTAYIDNMKSVPAYESRNIPNWNSDLHQLIALRHLRNRLTHECGTLEQELCTQSEIIWLNEFYSRILKQTDPIALLEKRRRLENKSTKEKNVLSPSAKLQDSEKDYTGSKPHTASVVFVILLILLAWFLVVKLSII